MTDGSTGDGIPNWTVEVVPPPGDQRWRRLPLLFVAGAAALVLTGVTTLFLLLPGDDAVDPGRMQAGEVGPAPTAAVRSTDDDELEPSTRGTDPALTTTTESTPTTEPPAVCEVDLFARDLTAEAITCERGGLDLDESVGPWHNDLAAIFLDDGVTGEIRFEPRPDGSTDGPAVRTLLPGLNTLNPADARYGATRLALRFDESGQHVHLHTGADRSGRRTTLTFQPS